MRYFSTRKKSPHASFREALLRGQPPDKGLYFPSEIPRFPSEFVSRLTDLSNAEIAFEILRPYVDDEIPDGDLFEICAEIVDFPFPLVRLTPSISILELFHGPTLAFKDVGARFIGRCLGLFARSASQKIVVVVATSGDTGGAVAAGLHGLTGIEVVIMYPKDRVSDFQKRQLTAFDGNVTTLEVRGNFDECQALAKKALADKQLQKRSVLTSANSINIARWLPQQVYFAIGLKQWDGDPPIISVPSGNFGNLAAGMLAWRSGLPVQRFVGACNSNDTVPRFMQTGNFSPQPSVPTLSNAMDVGDPSNWDRVLEVVGHDLDQLTTILIATSASDAQTAETIERVHAEHGYILDPHAAVGYRALAELIEKSPDSRGIVLETAHPAKFDSVTDILGNYGVVPEPPSVLGDAHEIDPNYDDLREVILGRI